MVGGGAYQSTCRCTFLLHLLPISVVSTTRNLTNSVKLFLFQHISSLMKSNPLRFIFLSISILGTIAAALMGSRKEWRGFPNNPHQKLVFFPL